MKPTNSNNGLRKALGAVAFSTFAILSIGLPAPVAMAETATVNNSSQEDGGNQRINHAGKLRMLSQRLPAAACVLAYSGSSETAAEALAAASNKFDRILTGLRNGDPELGIVGAEKKRRTLVRLEEVKGQWEPFQAAINDILAGKNVEASMGYLSEHNMALLDAAKALVTEESAEYSNPAELTQANALLINFAGRQRMLTQKIAKESCGVETGNPSLGTLDNMKETVSLFETTLNALRDGMPAAGVKAPPTEEIRDHLIKATDRWNETKMFLAGITGKGSIGSEAQAQIFHRLSKEVKAMNVITGLYAAHSKMTQ